MYGWILIMLNKKKKPILYDFIYEIPEFSNQSREAEALSVIFSAQLNNQLDMVSFVPWMPGSSPSWSRVFEAGTASATYLFTSSEFYYPKQVTTPALTQ